MDRGESVVTVHGLQRAYLIAYTLGRLDGRGETAGLSYALFSSNITRGLSTNKGASQP
jgi:hypothetical protein